MRTTEAEQRQIEQTIYTDDYAGCRADPMFEQAIRSLLDRHILPRLPRCARLLDVGCGAGAFLAAAKERRLAATGIDVSEASAQLCRERGCDAIAGDFITTAFTGGFDAVTMWDVIEHLRDPGGFFERALELLERGGVLFGKVPAFGLISVQCSIQVPQLGRILLGAPQHVQYFSRSSLAALLSRKGFEVEWLNPHANSMRAKATGGSIKKRAARQIASAIRRWSNDENIYFAARPAT